MDYGIGITFIAGLVSFLSPCVLSLVPAYIGYISGSNLSDQREHTSIRKTLVNGCLFVLGFSLVFIALGFTASLVGQFLYKYEDIITKIGGIVICIFGLQMTGLINIPFLNYDLRQQNSFGSKNGFLSSFLMGIFFSAGWSPCIGPVLGSVLTSIAVSNSSFFQGILYLSAYSLGLGIPFLIAAGGVGWVNRILKKYKKATVLIQICSGAVLIIFGIMLFFGLIERITQTGALII